MSEVIIARNTVSIKTAIEEALSHVNLDRIISGRVVAVKPNDTWASREDTSAVTQKDTLKSLLKILKRHTVSRLIVSGGAGAAETETVFELTGMMDAVREEAAEFIDHNQGPFKEVSIKYAPEKGITGPQKSIMVNKNVLSYQSIVALSQLKVHNSADVTLALKNIAMSFPAADYYGHSREKMKHRHCFFDDLHVFIAGVVKRFPISLAVTVGHPAMIGRGPIGGETAETGLVIASADPVAADAAGAALLGKNPASIRQIVLASEMGLGEYRLDRIRFPLIPLEEAVSILKETYVPKDN